MEMVVSIYKMKKSFPKDEEFGLKFQLRRTAVSVPSNIAEGLTRQTKIDKIHFLNIADSSLSEIDSQLEIALRLKYMSESSFKIIEEKLIIVEKLLSGLIRSLK